MNDPLLRKRLIAITTCIFSIFVGILYLLMITILDSRGPMLPPPSEAFGVVAAVYDHFHLVDL